MISSHFNRRIVHRCRWAGAAARSGLLILLLVSQALSAADTVYYVSTSGSDTNSGLSASTAWRHIAHAATRAGVGDTVYIKVGNYGNEQVVVANNGVSGRPITFEGYQSTPGDRPQHTYAITEALDATRMPLLDGGNRAAGTIALDLTGRSYVTVRNLQVQNYQIGVYAYGVQQVRIDTIIGTSFGDTTASYNGTGISIGSLAFDSIIANCQIFNAAAEGISCTGDRNTIQSCSVQCNDNSTGVDSAMDYYIIVAGSNNVIAGSSVERIGNLGHLGHGISLKTTCIGNAITNCTTRGMAGEGFSVRHHGVTDNTFTNCVTYGPAGFVVRDGASRNTFRNCHSINAESAVFFMDALGEDDGISYAGNDNQFIGCIFECVPTGCQIDFNRYNVMSSCDNTTFNNCIFSGGAFLFNAERPNTGTLFTNCIFTGIANFNTTNTGYTLYPVNASITYSDAWNTGFSLPSGSGNIAVDPLFANAASGDFHLKSTGGRWNPVSSSWIYDTVSSPCIDAGDPASGYSNEPLPNGGRVNQGAYGNSSQASRSSQPLANVAPTVSAGPDRAITLPAGASLDGTVSDDGLPSGTLTQSWSVVSGPGTVSFANASAVDTTATFSLAGTYGLRLSASDGSLSNSDDLTVTVAGTVAVPTITVSTTAVAVGGQVTVTVTGGPGNLADWVGLFDAATPVGAGEVPGLWSYLDGTKSLPSTARTSATLTFTMPMLAGTYVFRFCPDDAHSPVLAASATVTVLAAGLPAGWTTQDVGAVAAGGSASENAGTWTVSGSGVDIWGSADEFHFAWRQVSGDVQVTARVTGLGNTDPWAKAGVMLRQSLAAGSRQVSTVLTPANGVSYVRRLATNGASAHTAGARTVAPYWVRLQRVGNVVTSSSSADGSIWKVIRTQTVTLGTAIYVGLAVTSHNDGQLCTATFTNVQIVSGAAAAN